jgi:putative redox protein
MTMTTGTTGVQMQVVSEPQFKCRLTHGPSGTVVHSEAPKDNGGTGGSFSPTDLVGAALASCAVTTMALAAGRENVPWGEASAQVEKRMTPPPRRIGELVLEITMPRELPKDQRARFEQIARECPVSRSLHPDLKVPMTFVYQDR